MLQFNDHQTLFLDKVIQEELAKYPIDKLQLAQLKELFERYQNQYLRDGIIKEEENKVAFLKDLFQFLNYTERENFRFEGKTEIDSTQPDGRLGSNLTQNQKVEVVIEWKGTNTSLDQLKKSPVNQAWEYVSGFDGCLWYIVGNFKEIRLYHRNYTRKVYQGFLLSDLCVDDQILKQFAFLFAKENLLKNNFETSFLEKLLDKTRDRKDQITNEFYAGFKQHRFVIHNHLKTIFPELDAKNLLSKTQSILDKITFIQFASSRRLLPENLLKDQANIAKSIPQDDDRFWYILKGIFKSVDVGRNNIKPEIFGYNGELFKQDPELEKISITDQILEDTFNFFTKYDFNNELSLDILGRIFEQSISDLEEMRAKIDQTEALIEANPEQVETTKKHSKRKKDGVFYTPEYITKYMTEEVINLYLSENPDKITADRIDIKVLDPACGSGAFLNQAHNVLSEKYKDSVDKDKFAKIGGDDFAESLAKDYDEYEINQNILHNNLYGVDLNGESVEITKLSLWLKTIQKNKKMQSLAGNIKQGNSLISDPEIASTDAFDWGEEFGHLKDKN
jgi:type I restriction-modification system DNA methylase subunit